MPNNEKNGRNARKQKTEMVTDFGSRKINVQNFSRTVVLPKNALSNCGCNLDEDVMVDVQLVQKGDEKFIKLIPICDQSDDENKKEVKK